MPGDGPSLSLEMPGPSAVMTTAVAAHDSIPAYLHHDLPWPRPQDNAATPSLPGIAGASSSQDSFFRLWQSCTDGMCNDGSHRRGNRNARASEKNINVDYAACPVLLFPCPSQLSHRTRPVAASRQSPSCASFGCGICCAQLATYRTADGVCTRCMHTVRRPTFSVRPWPRASGYVDPWLPSIVRPQQNEGTVPRGNCSDTSAAETLSEGLCYRAFRVSTAR